jgi:cytochrome c556
MTPMLKILVNVAFLFAAAPISVRADDKDVIDYRQHIMNTLNAQAAAMGMILSGVIPDDNVVAHLEAIALSAKTAQKAFEPRVLGGEAKPEVWTNWPDFSKRMNEFAQKTAEVAKIAREKGKEAAMTNVLDALPCKPCHEKYRTEKKN